MKQNILLLLLLVASANAGPLSPQHRGGGCAVSCPAQSSRPAYTVGRAYTFDYSTDMRANIRGATEDSAGLRLNARVVFDFLAPCEVAMRLNDIRVLELDPAGGSWLESPHQTRFASELTASDAHFALNNDGLVGDVCAEITEPDWVLNIKKAIIGLLQNGNAGRIDGFQAVETDISGRCKVTYNVQQDSGKEVRVTKITDLMSCPDQQKVRSSFQSSSYRTSARIQSMPLTRANRTCQMSYDTSGHLKEAACQEEHMFRPFSTETAGAVTVVEQKMTFVGTGGIIRIAHDHMFRRSKLEYQHHDYKLASQNPEENVRSVLSSLCDLGTVIVPKTPALFNELIYRLRELSTEQLVAMRRDVEGFTVCRRNNQMAKQFFFDALPAVTTPAAVQMMKGLIVSGQVSSTEADAWLTSLAFVQEPTKEMLESLLPLLQVDSPRQQAQLGITALVNQYCKAHDNCNEEPVVRSIGAAIQTLIGSDCSAGDRKTLLVALKAVGNAGYLTELLPAVAHCANKESNLMEVRVAAIEALRRTPCSVDRRPLLRLIRNMDLDSELRIAAYLGLMTCPNIEVLETVRELLTAESSNQFASFMWTHLTNLVETSDPHKQDIRMIVEDVKLKNQYDMDKLKFSRNIEKSFFSNYLNAGAKVESNLIWSQKSFLPRSATLNMTLDLFGKSLNFLEVGGRVQGMEVLLEKYLGPRSNKSNETNTNTELAQLDNTFKVIEDKIGGNLDIKIFGHQIAFLDLWKEDLERSSGNIFELLNSLRRMSDISWSKSISFMDTQVTIPTISGFPLRLGINGTASFILKANSKVNLKKLMQWPPEFEFEGKLVPSGAVHVSGMLGINTIYGDYGVKMVSNIFTSTEMQASVKAANGEELKVEIHQPRQRQNILNAKTSFFIVHRSVEREQRMRRDLTVSKKICSSGGVIEKVLGVEFCSEVRYPYLTAPDAPQTPLLAGFELDLSMIKKDTHDSYLLHLINRKTGVDRHWRALVDMPGSRNDRKIQAEMKFDSAGKKLEAILETPWKKGKTEMSLTTGTDGNEMSLLAEMDGVTYASAKARYNLIETSQHFRMELSALEVRLLNSRPIILKGAYGYSKISSKKSWEMAATIENLLTSPIGFRTQLKYDNGQASATASVNSPLYSGRIESNYNIAASSISGLTTVGYTFGHETERTVKIEPAIKLDLTSDGHNLRSSVKTIFSDMAHLNNYVALAFKRTNYHDYELDASFEDANRQIIRLFGKYTIEKPSSGHEHKLKTIVQHGEVKYGVEASFMHDLVWSELSSRLIYSMGSERVSTTLNFKRQPGTVFYTASLNSGLIGNIASKLENNPEKGSVAFETTLTMLETVYTTKAELLQKDSKHKISGRLSLHDLADVSAELSVDTSSSEPSVSAMLTTAGVTYSADAAGKFDYKSAVMNGKINAPGVDVQAKLQLGSEDSTHRLLAELFWNPRRQQSDGLRLDGLFQTTRRAHLQERVGRLEISVPSGAVAIRLNERNEPLKSNKYIEVEYAKDKKVSANFMYDINDGWTEKGIVSTLHLQTPFRRYENITLKLDGYGSLRVRKLQIESITNGRRFKADLLVNLGNINNFHSRLSIVTPWAHASFMKFELNHWLTSTEIKSKLDVDLKTEKIVIMEVHGFNKGAYSGRDVGLSLQTNSTLNWFPKLLLDFTHKDDLKQFTSKVKVAVNDGESVDLISNFDFYPTRDGAESRGNISLATPFPGFRTLSTVWNHKHNRQIVKTSSKFTYMTGKVITIDFDGYDENTAHGNRQSAANFLVSAPFMEDLKLKLIVKSANRYEANVQLKVPFVGDYQADILLSEARNRMHLKVDTPHESLSRMGLIYSEREDGDMEYSSSSEIYWNDELIKLTTKQLNSEATKMSELVLHTPFNIVKRERLLVQVSRSGEDRVAVELNHNGDNVLGVTVRRQDRAGKLDYGLVVETPVEWMKSIKISTVYLWKQTEKDVKASLVYNEARTSSVEYSQLTQSGVETVKFAIDDKSPYNSRGLSLASRISADSATTNIVANCGDDRKVSINNTIGSDGTFELEAKTPFEAISRLKVTFARGKESGETWISMVAKHDYFTEFRMVELQGRHNGWKKANLEVKMNPPKNWKADSRFVLNHQIDDAGKWLSSAYFQYNGRRIFGSSEFTVGDEEVSGTWKIQTPFDALEELKLHARNRAVSRFVENEHGFKVKSNGAQVQVANSFQLNGWSSVRFASQIDTNIEGFETIKVGAHQTIEASSSYDAAVKFESPSIPAFTAGLNCKMGSPGFEGNFYAKTPFSFLLKEMNATVQMSFTDWLYWTVKSKIELSNEIGGRRSIKKEIAFRGFTMAASFSEENPVSSSSANLKFEALRRDAVQLEGTLNAWGNTKSMKLVLEQPGSGHLKATLELTGLPVISAEAKLMISDSVRHEILILSGGNQVVKNDALFTMSLSDARRFIVNVNTTVLDYRQEAGLEVKVEESKLSINARHTCSWMSVPVIFKFETEKRSTGVAYLSANANLQGVLTDPVTMTLLFNLEDVLKGVAEFDLRVPSMNRICYGVTWNFLTSVAGALSIELPLVGSIESKLSAEGEELLIMLEMPSVLSEKWELRISGTASSLSRASLSFRLLTSLPDYREISVTHIHNLEDDNQLTSELMLPGWTKKARVHFSVSKNKVSVQVDGPGFEPIWGELFTQVEPDNFEVKLTGRWNAAFGSHDLEVRTKLVRSTSPAVFLLDTKLPLKFFGYADAARVKLDGDFRSEPTTAFNMELQVALSETQLMTQLIKTTYGSVRSKRVFTVNVPSVLSVSISQDGKKTEATITVSHLTLELSQQSTLNGLNDFEILADAKISGESTRQAEFYLHHHGNWWRFNNRLSVKLDMSSAFEYQGRFNIDEEGMKSEFSLETPATDRMSVRLAHQGTLWDFSNYLEIRSKYHAPVVYKGQCVNFVGEFEASLPTIGGTKVQIKRDLGKMTITAFANNSQKLTLELDSESTDSSKKMNIKVATPGFTMTVKLEGSGFTWTNFERKVSININEHEVHIQTQHRYGESALLSANYKQRTNTEAPVHSIVIGFSQSHTSQFDAELTLIRSYGTLFSIQAKKSKTGKTSLGAVTLRTIWQGLHFTHLSGSYSQDLSHSTPLHSTLSELKLINDYTGENKIAIETNYKDSQRDMKATFDSAYLGKHSIKYSATRLENTKFQFAAVEWVEIKSANSAPITLQIDQAYSHGQTIQVKLHLKTAFENAKDSKLAIMMSSMVESQSSFSFKLEQDYLGTHEMRGKIESSAGQLAGDLEIDSEIYEVDKTKFAFEFKQHQLKVSFNNGVFGAMLFNGRAEVSQQSVSVGFTAQAPWSVVETSVFNFEWKRAEEGMNLELRLKSPLVGENSIRIAKTGEEVGSAEIKSLFYLSMYIEKINERLSLQSTFSSKVENSQISASGSHSILCNRLGEYTLSEEVQVGGGRVFATATVKTPLESWDKTSITYDFEAKDTTRQLMVKLDTKLFGVQDLTFRVNENDLTGHITVLSIRNELTITGWMPKWDNTGAISIDFFVSVSSPIIKTSGRVGLKPGHFSAMASTEVQSKTATVGTSATWKILPRRLLLDVAANAKLGDIFSQAWGVMCDLDVANVKEKRLVVKLVAPVKSIETTELAITFKSLPLMDASITIQSPHFGHFNVKGMWHAANGLLVAPISAKFRIETSIDIVPKFEVSYDHAQKHENMICEFGLRSLSSGEFVFKFDSVYDAFNRVLQINFGSNRELSVKWQSKSDLLERSIDERLEAVWNQQDKYSAEAVYSWSKDRTVVLKVTTPFAGYEQLGVEIVAQISMPFDLTVKLMVPNQVLKAQAVLDLTDGVHTRFALKLPGLPDVELAFQAAGSLRSYNFELTTHYGTKRFSIITNWDLLQDKRFKVRLETPVADLRLAEVYASVSGDINAKRTAKFGVTYNDYANELKLSKEPTEKGLKLRVHYPGKLVELELMREGHDVNKAYGIIFQVDNQKLVEISTRLTYMFSSNAWSIRLPHSGFLKIDSLFGTVLEQSSVEWGYRRIGSLATGLNHLSVLLKVQHRDSHVSYEMSMQHEGKFQVRVSAEVPEYNIRLDEVVAAARITGLDSQETRITVDISHRGRKVSMSCVTNWRNTLQVHLGGINGLVSFVNQDSLTLHAVVIRSQLINEISIRVSGLQIGELRSMVSLKKEKGFYQVSVGGEAFKRTMEGHLLAKSRQGWLSSSKEHNLEARINLFCPVRGSYVSTWSAKFKPGVFETDLTVAASETKLLSSKVNVNYHSELNTNVEWNGFGVNGQVVATLRAKQWDLSVKSGGVEIVRVISSFDKSGYRTVAYNQRLSVLYMGQVALSFEYKQDVVSWIDQFSVTAKLEVARKTYLKIMKVERKAMSLDVDVEWDELNPIKVRVNCGPLPHRPKLEVTFGPHNILAQMNLQPEEGSMTAELRTANPWLPVTMKINHVHRQGYQKVLHEYEFGERKYILDSSAILQSTKFTSKLHYSSPRQSLKIDLQTSFGTWQRTLTHSIQHNGVTYIQLDGNMQRTASPIQGYLNMYAAAFELSTGEHRYKRYLPHVKVSLRHHFNEAGWKQSTWSNEASVDEWKIAHTGKVDWSSKEANSRLVGLGHENSITVEKGSFHLQHTAYAVNIVKLSVKHNQTSTELKFNNDLTSFHTNVQLTHNLGLRTGGIAFEQTGSIETPKISANWNLNMPSLRGELKLGDARLWLEHEHRSNKDFSCHYSYTRDSEKHELKGKFAAVPSTRHGYHTEIEGTAEISSTWLDSPLSASFQHHHNNWLEHSCAGKIHAGNWKLLHKSVVGMPSQHLAAETYVHNGVDVVFEAKLSSKVGHFVAESKLQNTVPFKVELLYSSKKCSLNIFSDRWTPGLKSTTTVEHNIESWRQGKVSVSSIGSLSIRASTEWHLAADSKRIQAYYHHEKPLIEIDLATNKAEENTHYSHRLRYDSNRLAASGVYDARSILRFTEANIHVEKSTGSQNSFTWAHRLGSTGFVKTTHSSLSSPISERRTSWDFSSASKSSLEIHHPRLRLSFAQTNPTSGKFSAEFSLPTGAHTLTGSLEANPSWLVGQVRLNNTGQVLAGSWNVEDQKKTLDLDVNSFKLSLQHLHRGRNSFDFSHRMSCVECPLSAVLPERIVVSGALNASSTLQQGKISTSLTVNNDGPLPLEVSWNFEKEQSLAEFSMPNFRARFANRHVSWSNFSFNHTVTLLGKSSTAQGAVKVEPSADFSKRLVAHFEALGQQIDVNHEFDGPHRHRWNYKMQIASFQFESTGHRYSGESLLTEIAYGLDNLPKKLQHKLSWTPGQFEYWMDKESIRKNHVKFSCADAEKSALILISSSDFGPVKVQAKMQKTCTMCFSVVANVSVDASSLGALSAQLLVPEGDEPIQANGLVETPFGKVEIRNKIIGKKLGSFKYVASVSTGSDRLRLDVESEILSTRSVKFSAALQNFNLLPLINNPASFSFSHSIDAANKIEQSIQLRYGNGIPFAYSLSSELLPMHGSLLAILPAKCNRKSSLSINWLSGSFVEVKMDGPFSLSIASSNSALPTIVAKLQPKMNAQGIAWDAEFRLGERAIEGSLTIDPSVLELRIRTPFAVLRKLGGKIALKWEQPMKLATQAGIDYNDYTYSVSLSADIESLDDYPRGMLRFKIESPHKVVRTAEFSIEHRKSSQVWSAQLAAGINGKELKIDGSITDDAMRLRIALPIDGYQKIGFKALRDEEESQARLHLMLQMPHGNFGKVTTVGTYSEPSDFTSRVVVETSSLRYRHAELNLQNQLRERILEHTSSMKINGEQWHSIQIKAGAESGEIKIERTQPIRIKYQLKTEVRTLSSDLKVTIGDWVPFHLQTQLQSSASMVNATSFLSLRTPHRTVQIKRKIYGTSRGFAYELSFTPNHGVVRPLTLVTVINNKGDARKIDLETKVHLYIPSRRIETSFRYQQQTGEGRFSASVNWDAGRAELNKVLAVAAQAQFTPGRRVACSLELMFANQKPYRIEFSSVRGESQILHSSEISLDITNNSRDKILMKFETMRTTTESVRVQASMSQASSNVDFKIDGEVKSTLYWRIGNFSIHYIDSASRPTMVQSIVEFSSSAIKFDLILPTKRCSVELKKSVEAGDTVYSLKTHGQKLELRLLSSPDYQLIYEPREKDRLWMGLGYADNWHLRADIHRVTNSVKMQQLLAEAQLKSRHMMKVKLHWNPTSGLLRYAALRESVPMLLQDASSLMASMKSSCVHEILSKVSTDLVLPDLANAAQIVAQELEPLGRDISYMNAQFRDMYARNEFYSRDIYQAVSEVASALASYTVAVIERGIEVYSAYVHPHVVYTSNRITSQASRCYDHATQAYHVYRRHRDHLYRTVNGHVLRYINGAVDSIRPALDAAHGGYQSLVQSNPFRGSMTTLGDLRVRVARSVSEVDYNTFNLLHDDIREQVLTAHRSIEARIRRVTDSAAEAIASTKTNVRHHVNRLVGDGLVSSVVSGAYAQSKWFLDHFNIEKNLKDFAKDNYLQGVEYVRQNTIGLATDYLGLSKNTIIENNFSQGKFEAHLYSPMKWTDLKTRPTSGLDEVHGRLASSYRSARDAFNTVRRKLTAVRDVVYDSIPDFDMPSGSWIPKFKGVASVIGDHIVTFDGRHYDFLGSGECAYLLARDFRSRSWAISMTYASSGKSLDIFAYGKRIRVTPRLHVLIDGVQQELPLNIGDLSIVRTGSGLRAKDLGHLFTVAIDPEADTHTVSVSGWYHGRLGGLLGNFDNEPFNDLVGSTSLRVNSVQDFTGSWRLGACRHVNMASHSDVPDQPHEDCLSLFDAPRTSPFRRCYAIVDPAPFRDICAQERRSGGTQQQVCRAAVAYIRHCDAKGLRGLRAPSKCLSCSARSPQQSGETYRQLGLGQSYRLPAPNVASADIVLVLEERGCIGMETLRRLPRMINQLKRSLGDSGVSDVRFGLLGFGNPSHHRGKAVATERSRPHWHTLAGEIMGSDQQLLRVLAGLETHNTADTSVDGARGADALEAVRMAARLGELRPGASRHVILVACDECHEGRRTLQSVRQSLQESDVRLHVLTETTMPTYFYGRRSLAFGIDASLAFSPESPEGSAELHGYTKRPVGKCARLAAETGGSVFDLRYLRRRQYASRIDLFSRVFADRLASEAAGSTATGATGGYLECRCAASGCGTKGRLTCRQI